MLLCCNSVVNHQNQFLAPIRVFCVSSWPNLFISMVEPCIAQKNMCFKKCMPKANARGGAAVCSLYCSIPKCSIIVSSLCSIRLRASKVGPRSLEFKLSLEVFVWHTSFMFSSQSKNTRYMPTPAMHHGFSSHLFLSMQQHQCTLLTRSDFFVFKLPHKGRRPVLPPVLVLQ